MEEPGSTMSQLAHVLIAAMLALFSAGSAISESPSVSATLVTVHLFSVREVQSVTMLPHGGDGWMRTCAECPRKPVAAVMQFENGRDGIKFTSGDTLKRIELSGDFTVKASGYEQEVNAAGLWTITPSQSGLRVLLSLPSEHYVIAALSGEASPDEPLESLKAMAVSMRTFALVNADRHIADGFGLCDSTHCQALRFVKPRLEAIRAVKETAGETLWSGDRRAHIYFTQHCGGVTEAAANLWPREQAAYLSSHQDQYCLRRTNAAWSAQVSLDQLSTIFQHEGWHTPTSLKDVRIVERTRSGRVRLLEVSGLGTPAPISASSFRFAVDRALGWNQLRSDWYSVKVMQGVLRIDGKGYGHGVGLCQAGAYEMAAEGHDYRQILSYYFPGTVARVALSDSGWKSYQGTSLTLLSVTPAASLLAQANRAWAQANSAFSVGTSLHPKVYALPTTELFRQTTGEPGWVLASTRGTDVYLQPSAILEKNGRSNKVLLHEFLHVLIEHEATSQTPLWLREGLVEALAEGDGYVRLQPVPNMSFAEMETALAHPVDFAASQCAHIAAGQMASRLVKRYGVTTVKNWLRNGIPTSVAYRLTEAGS
jgi:stage II sporulation protein D